MALPETTLFTRWLQDRLRVFAGAPGRRPAPGEDVRHRGVVVTVCVLASILLWFTFAMRETYTRSLEFPLEVRNLDPAQALSELPPSVARAQVVGEGIQLLTLFYNPPVIPVDASASLVDLEAVLPEVIHGVRLESISPRSVTLRRERRESRRVPVVLRVVIQNEPGHHIVGSPTIEPDSVTVSGAASIVRRLTGWATGRGTVRSATDTLDVMLALSDTLNGLVELDVDRVRARASVTEFTQGSRLVEVRVVGVPPGQRVSLEPSTVRATFQVPLADFQAASSTPDLYAVVPYEAIRIDTTGSVRPELHVPAGLVFRAVAFEPASLRYFDVQDFR